jgi:hypothetical protein
LLHHAGEDAAEVGVDTQHEELGSTHAVVASASRCH